MSGLLDQRTAIVTGGARGAGFAIAQTLVMHGARVVIADNGAALDGSPEDSVVTESAVDRCNQIEPDSTLAFGEDLSAPGAGTRLCEFAVDRLGGLDIVVNSAGIDDKSSIFETGRERFDAVVATNLAAPFEILSCAARIMAQQVEDGRIPGALLNLVSAGALFGGRRCAADAAARGGLIALTRAIALELLPTGVICNALIPLAGTRWTRAVVAETDRHARFLADTMAVSPSWVANVACWLSSPQAARVTGQVFAVRGREVMMVSQPEVVATAFQEPGVLDPDMMAQAIRAACSLELAPPPGDWEPFDRPPVL